MPHVCDNVWHTSKCSLFDNLKIPTEKIRPAGTKLSRKRYAFVPQAACARLLCPCLAESHWTKLSNFDPKDGTPGDGTELPKPKVESGKREGRTQFAQKLSAAERNERNQSDERKIQARIKKMFADTRKLLGRYLSTRPVSELQQELGEARRGDSS